MTVELPNPQEMVLINIGQAGCQIGSTIWELFNEEHDINPDGTAKSFFTKGDMPTRAVYDEVGSHRYVPRCIFIDLEDSSINDIKKSPYRTLFHPDQMIFGRQDSSNNYGRAYYNYGKRIIEKIIEIVRRQVEMCRSLQGIFIIHSLGGGTGSGLYTLLLENISQIYKKTFKFDLSVFPTPHLTNILVEPYNALLSTSISLSNIDLGFIMDNEAVWEICSKKLSILRPSFCNINRLIAQVISGITAPLRFKGSLQGDMVEFQTNLVAYPRLHFPLVTFSPILPEESAKFDSLKTWDLTQDLFRWDHSFVKCDLAAGRYMSACLLYRGDVSLKDARDAIERVKRRVKFASWCPAGIKLDLNSRKQAFVSGADLAVLPRSCCMAANHTSVKEAWATVIRKFELLYRKRAFLHWFVGEGVEEEEFQLSREEMCYMMTDYEEASLD